MAKKRKLNSNNDSWVNMVNGISQAIALQQQQQQISNEDKYKQWAMNNQGTENQIALAKAGLMPNPQGDINIGGQNYSRRPPIMPDLSGIIGKGSNGIGFTGGNINPMTGDMSITFGQTPESKINEQSMVAAAKERETAIGKANRLQKVGESVQREWLKTSPYKGLITKTGLVPVLGMWDIVKKGAGATDAQQRDQAYASFVKGIRAQLARGMGDVGNLSETEQQAVSELVPTLFDSYESGIKKLEQISALVEDIRKTRDTQGFSTFTIDGTNYKIPREKVKAFMKAKGLE